MCAPHSFVIRVRQNYDLVIDATVLTASGLRNTLQVAMRVCAQKEYRGMRIKLAFVLAALALAALWVAPTATAQHGNTPAWVWVCHNGNVLLVSTNSSHVAHFDPSEAHVPGLPPSEEFVEDCVR